jgi:hypothetical protein
MTRLVAFGCSHTYGMGLPDCFNRVTKFAGEHPSKLAWPELLANKLGVESVNLSRPGNSCKRIWHDVISTELTDLDTVVILWTHPSRWCVFKENTEAEDIAHYLETPTTNTYYRLFHNHHDSNVDLNLRMSHVSLYLNFSGIENYHLIYKPNGYQKLDFNSATTLDLPYSLNDLKLSYPKGVDKNHPGEQAHEIFANEIFLKITEKKGV